MKHGKIIKGNVIITKDCKDDFSEVEQITGNLDIYSDAKLEALQSVGGYLDICSDAKLEAPNLQSVGGNLYIYSDAKLEAPNLQSVGGNLRIYSDAKLEAPNLQSVGGYLYICSDAKLEAPNLQSVGGYLYIYSDAKLEAPNAKFNVEGTAQLAQEFNFQCFLKMGYLFADRMLAKLISKKKIGKTCIYKIQLAGQTKISYCIEVDGVYSHGDTVEEAKDSLKFKISDRDTSMYNDYTLDTEVTFAEGIQMYRKITGACELGTRHFVNHILSEKKDKYKVKEIIKLTKGQYNHEKLVEFFS